MIYKYNPDVLSCLANLSNDEVFTPPTVVNKMLDMLPSELWSNSKATFLDPVSKTGIFLREIAKRLMVGLADEIPDMQERANHILTKQVFGIAITELTSLLSRRSLYCSKRANGALSVCTAFNTEDGNITYSPTPHTWQGGRCKYCGASQSIYERDASLEAHAYQFIHTNNPENFFKNMKFDVIIGNPPYQMEDGGNGKSAKPIYHLFIKQAKRLNPRYLTMVIPARWYSGGKGLDDFRDEMLNDNRISNLVDFFDSNVCFPGVDLSGGICYFLWERDKIGLCQVTTYRENKISTIKRNLLEDNSDIFIRFNEAISIINKVKCSVSGSFISLVSSRKPFGIPTNISVNNYISTNAVKIYSYPTNGYISKDNVLQNHDWIKGYKVYIAKAYGERGAFPYLVLGKPFIGVGIGV